MFETIIISVLLLSFVMQLFFYFFFYIRVFFSDHSAEVNHTDIPVSVIISAKNEFNNLEKFLPKVLNQNYPNFQVIVVNDVSTDKTSQLLHDFSLKYSWLDVIDVDMNSRKSGKKHALTLAVNASKFEFLLFTDADCYPISENWISSMMSGFSKNTEIVLGYGAYEESKGFLNKMIRFETLFIALKYFSFAKAGLAYMGVGRNLAYKKSCFIENHGYRSHQNMKSGDDDLFINEIANKKNTSVVFKPCSITKSIPEQTLTKLIKQKQRHLTTGFKYKPMHKFLLATDSIFLVLFYLATLVALFFDISLVLIVIIFFLKLIFQITIVSSFADIVKEKKNLIFIPIFEVLMSAINAYALISNVFVKNREWK